MKPSLRLAIRAFFLLLVPDPGSGTLRYDATLVEARTMASWLRPQSNSPTAVLAHAGDGRRCDIISPVPKRTVGPTGPDCLREWVYPKSTIATTGPPPAGP